jgi:uncharacterized membrane protein
MMNLKHLFKQPLRVVPTSVVIFLLVVALIGFMDATYLAVEHFQGRIPPCSVTADCERVLTSSYSTIAGLPVSLGGSIYYLIILIGAFYYLDTKNSAVLKWTLLFTAIGFMFSMWFVYIQVFVMHSYCVYCLGSFITSTILFVVAMELFSKNN